MNKKDQLMFVHRCGALLESGISLGEVLTIVSSMERSKKKIKIIQSIHANVKKGVSLHKSLLLTKIKFDTTLLAMIRNGENTGTLALSLHQAYQVMEKSGELKKKIFGALMYPSFIVMATIAMTIFLVMYIFPKIIPLFSSMNIELPFLTRAVRALYDLSIHYGLLVSAISILFIFILYIFYLKNIKFRRIFQKILLFIPIIGESLKKYMLSVSLRSIGTLLENGQSLVSILTQIAESTFYEPYKESWKQCHLEVTKGVLISESMKSFPLLFPPLVPNMVFIGEKAGSLATMFIHISRVYEQELDSFIKQLSTVIEPVLMIGMGILVGSVALSIILPIYEITNHLTK
ncbi:MAG: type II secretion system F family protein [Patescibacteria group bacterium]